jgi:hypothetical protein
MIMLWALGFWFDKRQDERLRENHHSTIVFTVNNLTVHPQARQKASKGDLQLIFESTEYSGECYSAVCTKTPTFSIHSLAPTWEVHRCHDYITKYASIWALHVCTSIKRIIFRIFSTTARLHWSPNIRVRGGTAKGHPLKIMQPYNCS